ncbi:cobalamin biosynthesis protein [Lentibacter sp. XHP0401]|uniref:cobalamin biosynthesis protein n=1 Tax=Lentibacter sp. XHP0401 TaxID=2984334 RepID=UPI0021E94866|nr:cobalamin biosynthesis protein [Lentibacter sp. XHP0401]MCV2892049.1 cobalamin biosynthesis protein [Lentibacter sp. XHP0401]
MIVAGFGFRKDAAVDSLRDALARFDVTPDKVATVAAKADATPFVELGLPIVSVSACALKAAAVLTGSPASLKQYGTGSVAEAAALAAAGPGARLLGARQISHDRMATCAIAIGEKK